MIILITIVHVIVCLFLIVVVLLQSGKAADLAGAFGGMGSQTVFGPRGSANALSKATTVAAALFMVTSMSLSIYATRGGRAPSLLDKASKPSGKQTLPVIPGQPGQQQPVPIGVETSVGGQKTGVQTIPVVPQTVPAGQTPKLPLPPVQSQPQQKK
jgi:preprotein translocase subunit SecG